MEMNKEPSLVVSAGDIFRGKAEIDIFCTYHQHLHLFLPGRLCQLSESEALGSLTMLCLCQQHTFTQGFTHSGLFLFSTYPSMSCKSWLFVNLFPGHYKYEKKLFQIIISATKKSNILSVLWIILKLFRQLHIHILLELKIPYQPI